MLPPAKSQVAKSQVARSPVAQSPAANGSAASSQDPTKGPPAGSRDERLAAALRENLRRRKAQARAKDKEMPGSAPHSRKD